MDEKLAPVLLRALKASGEKDLRGIIHDLAELCIHMQQRIEELESCEEEEEEEYEEVDEDDEEGDENVEGEIEDTEERIEKKETPPVPKKNTAERRTVQLGTIPDGMKRIYPEPKMVENPLSNRVGRLEVTMCTSELESWREQLKVLRDSSKRTRPSVWEEIIENISTCEDYTIKELRLILGLSRGQLDKIFGSYPVFKDCRAVSGESLVYAACKEASKKYC